MTRAELAEARRHFVAGLRARYSRSGGWVFTPGNGLTMERYLEEAWAAYVQTLEATA